MATLLRTLLTGVLIVSSPLFALVQEVRRAPRLVLKTVEGRTLRLSDYKGKVVLLNFWATWCAPCRAEMPDLIRWQRRYRSRGLQVIGITYPPQELEEVRRFALSIKANYPIGIGDKETMALFDSGETLPITVVIDRHGYVREVIKGVVFEEEFDQIVLPLFDRGA